MYSPQLTDRLLMGLGRQRGPAVDVYPQREIVEETANEFARNRDAENLAAGLRLNRFGQAMQQGLGEKRLSQGSEQFEKGLAFAKQKYTDTLDFEKYKFNTQLAQAQEEAQQNRRLADTSALISLGGLGVESIGMYQQAQRNKKIQQQYDAMIDFYKNQGTTTGKFYADWLDALRIE